MSFLLSVIIGYVIVCLALFFRQDAMIYFPDRDSAESLERLARTEGFAPWNNARGERIGWKSADGDPESFLLIFHGNAGYALHRSHYRDVLRRAGDNATVCLLEHPGYGARDGRPSEKSLTEAAVEAVEALSASPGGRLRLVGESLGSGVACAAAGRQPEAIDGMILVTPFDSLVGAARAHYPWLPVGVFLRTRFDSVRHLKAYPGPVAFILGGRDSTIPTRLGERLFEHYDGRKRLWLVPNAGHNDSDLLLGGWREIAGWLESR